MFINKTPEGNNNVCGRRIAGKRVEMGISQRELSDRLQLSGLDIDKNAVQRIESGKRFVTDIELKHISRTIGLSYSELLD